jgi:hypothetical protein
LEFAIYHLAKRRANGEGSIYQRADKRWVAEVKIAGNPKPLYFYRRQQKNVKPKLDAVLENAKKGNFVQPSKMTFSEWLDVWKKNFVEQRVAGSTLDKYESWIENHIKPILDDYTLQELSTEPDILPRKDSVPGMGCSRSQAYLNYEGGEKVYMKPELIQYANLKEVTRQTPSQIP